MGAEGQDKAGEKGKLPIDQSRKLPVEGAKISGLEQQLIAALKKVSFNTRDAQNETTVQIETIQELGGKTILMLFKSGEARDDVLKELHPQIRGCVVAHFGWQPEMDAQEFSQTLKLIQIGICEFPKWPKDALPKILAKIGQVENELLKHQFGLREESGSENGGPRAMIDRQDPSEAQDSSARLVPSDDNAAPMLLDSIRFRTPRTECTQKSSVGVPLKKRRVEEQETHLSVEKLKFLVGVTTSNKSVLGTSAVGRKRGVALLVYKDVQVLDSGCNNEGRLIWAKLKKGNEVLSVAFVYAPNETENRLQFWPLLSEALPAGEWVLLGDWNSVSRKSPTRANVSTPTGRKT
ncbi:hypothetical protein R1sor_017261 [Riccia sorocarpa]|uniref:Uncharacterized protein n=1 Tax=Riccia sorocarpa TaxID=122646 RepID=A0ABD3I9P2_9MARC